MPRVRLVPAGDAALTAEYDDRIDPGLNARVIALASAMRDEHIGGIRDIVPTFRSVTVYFDPLATDIERVSRRLRELSESQEAVPIARGPVIDIPVCYGGEFGPDLDAVAQHGRIAADEVVAVHTARSYRAYMLGFLPGFAYLGVVDVRIAAPRQATPRRAVPAGSVGVAGPQTGVYPCVSPGGWNIIGRTPLVMFEPSRAVPALIAAGDAVRFHAIDRLEFDRLSLRTGSPT
jgi:KipI family sensor histidine kinase inhibitor